MLSSKFILTLLGLLVAVFSICNVSSQPNTVEGFWSTGGRKWKTVLSTKSPDCGHSATSGTFHGPLRDDQFIKNPSFQALMSPRFDNSGQTASLRYSPPAQKHMASDPDNPLLLSNSVTDNSVENYSGCSGGTCGTSCDSDPSVPYRGHKPTKPAFAAGNFNEVTEKAREGDDQADITSSLPLGTMTNIQADGSAVNPVVYQNFIYANPKSHLRSFGCPIRGDLAIVPCSTDWFQVRPNVNLDLHAGAMNVLTGNMNESGQATAQLIHAAGGGVSTPIGGVPLPFAGMNISSNFPEASSAAGTDISIGGMF